MTKLLYAIGLLLLSYGVVEAGEKHKPGDTWKKGDGCNTCEMDQYGTSYCTTLYCRGKNLEFESEPLPRELATCDPEIAKCETPCEKKMKEVMKMAQKYMHDSDGTFTTEYCDAVCKAEEKYQQLMEKTVKFAEWINHDQDYYMEIHVIAKEFLESPEVQVWRKEQPSSENK